MKEITSEEEIEILGGFSEGPEATATNPNKNALDALEYIKLVIENSKKA